MDAPLREAARSAGSLHWIAAGVAVVLPGHLAGVSWLLAIGMIRLTLTASLGLMAGGAVLQRIAHRTEERERLAPPRVP
jgi:hypothetical protein